MPHVPLRRPGAGLAATAVLALAATAVLALAAIGAVPAALTATAAPAAMAGAAPAAARDAATWLAGEVTDGALPGPFGGEDWGLTIDALLALAAADVDGPTRQEIATQVAAHVRSYNSYDDYGIPGFTDGGATAKLLFAAAVVADPADFGGYDLRDEVLGLLAGADAGDQRGRVLSITTPDTGPDASNTFDQSFAVLGLARSGEVPQDAVDFLVRQQCAAGGFRLYPDAADGPSPSCDAQPDATLDVDATAMAVQALLAAAQDGTSGATQAAARGAGWLADQQHDDGSFGGSGPTTGANSNSTGLAGQALAAAGVTEAAEAAADAVARLQLTAAGGGAAAGEAGAIAYNAEALTAAVAGGIGETERDQWRRATAQASLGLARVSLGQIGLDPPASPDPTGTATATPSGSPSASPTGTPTGSASPTGTPTGSPSASGSPSPTASPTTAAATVTPTTAPGGGLPTTGVALAGYLLLGLVLVGLGAVLLVFARRRAA